MSERANEPGAHRRAALMAMVAALAATSAAAHDAPTNRQMLDSCIHIAVRQAVSHWPAGGMSIIVDSTPDMPLLTAPLFRAASERGVSDRVNVCRARLTEAATSYRIAADGLLLRTITVAATFDVRNAAGGAVLWASEEHAQLADTIACDDVQRVERGEGLAAAHAPDPCLAEASSLSSIVEPAMLAIASATIVILLFAIRGR